MVDESVSLVLLLVFKKKMWDTIFVYNILKCVYPQYLIYIYHEKLISFTLSFLFVYLK